MIGFRKSAAFGNHNDGSEFKIQDTEPMGFVAGPGGMAPSGIPSYQPTNSKVQAGNQLSAKAAEKKRALDIAMLSKMADGLDYVSTQGQGAETLATQLKYETTSPDIDNEGRKNLPSAKKGKPMKFAKGFHKSAASAGAAAINAAKAIGKGAVQVGKGIGEGGKEALKGTIGDAMNLKGMKHLSDAYKSHGVAGLKTPEGQKAWGSAIGKAAPSLAAGTGYAYGLKKVYDKTLGSNGQSSGGYY